MIPVSIKISSIRLSPVEIAAMAIEGKLSSVHGNNNRIKVSYNSLSLAIIISILSVMVMVGPGE